MVRLRGVVARVESLPAKEPAHARAREALAEHLDRIRHRVEVARAACDLPDASAIDLVTDLFETVPSAIVRDLELALGSRRAAAR